MPDPIVTSALVLGRERRGDTSLTLGLFSRDLGRLRCTARGALAPGSRLGAAPDLFQTVEVQIRPAARGRLHFLSHAATVHDPRGIRAAYGRFAFACHCAGLVERCLDLGHPAPDVFDLLAACLGWLEGHDPTLAALGRFESRLLQVLGLGSDGETAQTRSFPALFQHNFGPLPPGRAALLRQLTNPPPRVTDPT